MARIVEGQLTSRDLRVALIVSRFNDAVTERLLKSATDCLTRHGGREDLITVVRVPGVFELPLAASLLMASGEHDGVVALGCILRGETAHFDLLASQITASLGRLMETHGRPVGFGVLTCDTLEQAMQRSGGKAGNKGWEATLAVIEMCSLLRELKATDTGKTPR